MVAVVKNRSIGVIKHAAFSISLRVGFVIFAMMVTKNFYTSYTSETTKTSTYHKRPFEMPIKGEKYSIFQPLYDMDESKKDVRLFASPKEFTKTFEKRISWVDGLIGSNKTPELNGKTSEEHAKFMYLEMIKSTVTAVTFDQAEMTVNPSLGKKALSTTKLDLKRRQGGKEWTYAGDTMTGWARMENIRNLLTDVIKNDIKGDYIETGVWRGGASVYAKAILETLEPGTKRLSYVCDSFAGLPPGDKALDKKDQNWDNTPYLEVSFDIVANNFIKYGMLDSNVVFAKGFFNETMPPLSEHIKKLSVMRLDVS